MMINETSQNFWYETWLSENYIWNEVLKKSDVAESLQGVLVETSFNFEKKVDQIKRKLATSQCLNNKAQIPMVVEFEAFDFESNI